MKKYEEIQISKLKIMVCKPNLLMCPKGGSLSQKNQKSWRGADSNLKNKKQHAQASG